MRSEERCVCGEDIWHRGRGTVADGVCHGRPQVVHCVDCLTPLPVAETGWIPTRCADCGAEWNRRRVAQRDKEHPCKDLAVKHADLVKRVEAAKPLLRIAIAQNSLRAIGLALAELEGTAPDEVDLRQL